MFSQIRDSGCWVHTLVNNAGIAKDTLVAMMSQQSWRDVLSTNLDGSFYCARAAIPTMIARKAGQIVNVASVSALRAQVGQVNYSAAKAGMVAMTRGLSRELGRYGIRVNAVAPGFIETEMLVEMRANPRGQALLEQARDERIPLARFGTAQEVGQTVAFLCSSAASYVTGHVLVVDGGLSV